MFRHRLLSLLVMSLLPMCAMAQKDAHQWRFGYRTGMDFNTSPPFSNISSKIYAKEGCSSAADSSGNLLFYTDGISVWNRLDEIMTSGTDLLGGTSSTHAALVVRQPGSLLYYIFTSCDGTIDSTNKGVHYAVVDMRQNNGLGQVTVKNVRLHEGSAERLSAVHHGNGKDVWLASIRLDTDTLFLFRITDQGLNSKPIKQVMKIKISGVGQMKFSPNGANLAFADHARGEAIVFDFNHATGSISNRRRLVNFDQPYGLEFSPNSKMLYIGESKKIYQCDLDGLTIFANKDTSALLVANTSNLGGMQLGPDGKIYTSRIYAYGLGTINYPNQPSPNCQFDDFGQKLLDGHALLSLPSFLQSAIYKPLRFENRCSGDTTSITAFYGDVDSIHWDFGDKTNYVTYANQKTVAHRFQTAGTFSVKAMVFYKKSIDSLIADCAIGQIVKPNLGNDTLLCESDSLRFTLNHPTYSKVEWSNGLKEPKIALNGSQTCIVNVSNEACSAADTVQIFEVDCDIRKRNSCIGDSVALSLSGFNTDSMKWDIGAGFTTLTTSKSFELKHQYTVAKTYPIVVELYYKNLFHRLMDSITVVDITIPNLGNDTLFCKGDTLHFNVQHPNYDSYEWSDGSTQPKLDVTDPGQYWVRVKQGACVAGHIVETYQVDCGLDVRYFCLGDTTFFKLNYVKFDSIYWWFGDGNEMVTTSSFTQYPYVAPGNFPMLARGYVNFLFVQITYPLQIFAAVPVSLGTDTSLCFNDEISVQTPPNQPASTYVWSTGEKTESIAIKKSGTYWVQSSYQGCIASDSIWVDLKNCDCQVYIPNAFTPNNNGINDAFKPVMNCDVESFRMDIYNLWGEKIFSTNNPTIGWSGRYFEIPSHIGTYLYVIEFKTINQPPQNLQGTFTLLR